MMLLPIVERELRVAARLTATYRNRMLAAGVVAATAMVMLLFGSFVQMPSLVGGAMFKTLAGFTFLFCASEGVRKTADCLSDEKREGTLGLLFLTDLKGYDIVLGKLTATSLNSIYGFLAILPVLALPLLLGGVTPGEFWRMVLALLNLLFFSLCAGIWVSCRNRSEYRAMGWALLLIAAVILLPLLTFSASVSQFSPAFACHAAYATVYSGSSDAYWRSLGMTQLLSWTLLIWSSISASRCWQEERMEEVRRGWWSPRGNLEQRAILRRQLLELNPASWLAGRNSGPRVLLYVIILATAVNSTIHVFKFGGTNLFMNVETFLVPVAVLNFALKTIMAAQACHFFAEARSNNSLEMLLSTPLSVNAIIEGQLYAFRRIFLAPIVTVLVIEIAGPIAGLIRAGSARDAAGEVFSTIVFAAVLATFFLLDTFAVMWGGMWFGLSSKKEGQAIAKTVLFVLVIPLFSVFLPCFGAPFYIGLPIFWIVWSHQKLYWELRRIAATRHSAVPAEAGWLPVVGSGRI